jgi:hypothetical protein
MAQKQDDCSENMKKYSISLTVHLQSNCTWKQRWEGQTTAQWEGDSTDRARFWRLEWPSTHQCNIQKLPFWDFMDGMKLSPRGQFIWSVCIYFFWAFFSLTPDPKFWGGGGSSYLPPNLPTTHLPPSSCRPLPNHLLLLSPPSLELAN